MRFAVLADIHGNLPALEAVLRDMETTGAEATILPGDSTVGPLQADTLELFLPLRGTRHLGAGQLRAEPDRDVRQRLPADGRRPQGRGHLVRAAAHHSTRRRLVPWHRI